jgi:hypothetical protein
MCDIRGLDVAGVEGGTGSRELPAVDGRERCVSSHFYNLGFVMVVSHLFAFCKGPFGWWGLVGCLGTKKSVHRLMLLNPTMRRPPIT